MKRKADTHTEREREYKFDTFYYVYYETFLFTLEKAFPKSKAFSLSLHFNTKQTFSSHLSAKCFDDTLYINAIWRFVAAPLEHSWNSFTSNN